MRLSFIIFIFFAFEANCQKNFEVSIKPTEFLLLNFETHLGLGNAKFHYGILLSFRPSTRDSGLIKDWGSGAAGGYEINNHFNRLYTSYTLGLYQKTYFNKVPNLFLETDIFYRNWHFDKKPAEFHDAEKRQYEFKGIRTENVNVYCLKFLIGKTLILSHKEKKFKSHIDIYCGAGIRYKEETFETFNGYVAGTYYTYKIDKYYHVWPTPQVGVNLGLIKMK